MQLFVLQAALDTSSRNTTDLQEPPTEKLWLFRPRYVAAVFLKNEWNVYQFKDHSLFLGRWLNPGFQAKIRLLENTYLPPRASQFPKHLKTFPMRAMEIATNVNFWYCVMKYVNIWETCITQLTKYYKIHSKCKRHQRILVKQSSSSSLTWFQSPHHTKLSGSATCRVLV